MRILRTTVENVDRRRCTRMPHTEGTMRFRHMLVATVLLASGSVWASEILTEGVDNGRTGWVKDEKIFTTANAKDIKLLWKLKLESTPREMHNLFAPLIAEGVTTAQGTKEIGVVAGVSDDLFGIDIATGRQLWKVHFEGSATHARAGDTLCPGGQTAVPTMAQV